MDTFLEKNRLTNDRAHKLVFITMNNKIKKTPSTTANLPKSRRDLECAIATTSAEGQKETQASVTLDDSVTAEGYEYDEYNSDEHGLPDIFNEDNEI